MTTLVRRATHRGVVLASGLFLGDALPGVAEARRRIVEGWTPGTTVHRMRTGWLCRWRAPRWIACDAALGEPVVARDGAWTCAPLAPDEWARLRPPAGSLVRVEHGVAAVEPIGSTEDSIAAWLDVEPLVGAEVESLGSPAPLPPALEPRAIDLRERLKDSVPAAAPRMEEMRKALYARNAPGTASATLSPLARALSWLDGVVSSWVMRSPLGRAVGWRQARYVAKLLRMLEERDYGEALRHAIPLQEGEGDSKPSLTVPTPRSSLLLSARRPAARSAFATGSGVFDELRARYRQTFDALVREERFDEAAFVLAELLGNNQEAVAFLEKHGKARLAAELAEGRGLPPALVVRLWFIAGDAPRAVAFARRTGAFADAVERLEREPAHRAHAERLRLLWADHLATAGELGAAVEAVWPVVAARPLAERWIDLTLEQGGPAAVQMLVRKLELHPEGYGQLLPRVRALLDDRRPEALRDRWTFAQALTRKARTGLDPTLAQPLARATLRAWIRDVARLGHDPAPQLKAALLARANDGALNVDVGALARPNAAEVPTLRLEWSAAEAPTHVAWDAALLPGGQLLVALDEQGLRLLDEEGRTRAHFEVTARTMVVADGGRSALAIARHGEWTRVARVDLVAGKVVRTVDLRLDDFARDFDGALWFVARKDSVMALDVHAPDWRPLWRVGGMGGSVALERHRTALFCDVLTTDNGAEVERWVYELPSLTLRSRQRQPGGVEPWTGGRYELRQSQAVGGLWVEVHDTNRKVAVAQLGLGGAQRVFRRSRGPILTLCDDRGRVLALDCETGTLLRDVRVG